MVVGMRDPVHPAVLVSTSHALPHTFPTSADAPKRGRKEVLVEQRAAYTVVAVGYGRADIGTRRKPEERCNAHMTPF